MRRPVISRAQRPLTFEVEAFNERGEALLAPIAGEHPLTLYVDKREVVTLMTLGQAPEALAIGYLRNQRLAQSLDEIAEVQVDWETGAVAVTTRKGIRGLSDRMKKRTVTTGCGQGTVFGDLMEEIDSIRLRDDITLDDETLYALLDAVRRHETVYKSAGAVHGCALADGADGAGVQVVDEAVGAQRAALVAHLHVAFCGDGARDLVVDEFVGLKQDSFALLGGSRFRWGLGDRRGADADGKGRSRRGPAERRAVSPSASHLPQTAHPHPSEMRLPICYLTARHWGRPAPDAALGKCFHGLLPISRLRERRPLPRQ